jgi:hypothetical protein
MRMFGLFQRLHSHVSRRWSDVPRQQRAQIQALLLATIIGGSVVVWLYSISRAPAGTFDFSTYYAAASALRSDPHADIYSQGVLARSGAESHVSTQPPLPYTYPPLAALIMVPLTAFPFAMAARLWLAINAALWLASSLILCMELHAWFPPYLHDLQSPGAWRALAAPSPAVRTAVHLRQTRAGGLGTWARDPAWLQLIAVIMPVCLAWGPATIALSLGQIDVLVLLLLVIVFPLLRAERDSWAGIAHAFAAMLKLTPILLLVALALLGRWRAVVAGLAALTALTLAILAILGPQTCWAAVPQMLQVGSYDAALPRNEALLGAVTHALITAAPAFAGGIRVIEYLLLAALAGAIGILLWRQAPRSLSGSWLRAHATPAPVPSTALGYAIALCAMVLVSPLAWEHHYVWVLPAAVFVLAAAVRDLCAAMSAAVSAGERGRLIRRLGVAVGAVALVGALRSTGWDLTPWLVAPHLGGQTLGTWLHELRPIGTMGLLILAATQWQRLAHGYSPPAGTRGSAPSPNTL